MDVIARAVGLTNLMRRRDGSRAASTGRGDDLVDGGWPHGPVMALGRYVGKAGRVWYWLQKDDWKSLASFAVVDRWVS